MELIKNAESVLIYLDDVKIVKQGGFIYLDTIKIIGE
jgi:hypothetical protein